MVYKMINGLKSQIFISLILTSLVLIISFPLLTFAVINDITGTSPGGIKAAKLDTEQLAISRIIMNVTSWAAGLIAAVAVLFVIYAAYLYLTSAGDPAKVADATKYILWAVIASIVALSAFGIIALAKAVFGFA